MDCGSGVVGRAGSVPFLLGSWGGGGGGGSALSSPSAHGVCERAIEVNTNQRGFNWLRTTGINRYSGRLWFKRRIHSL